MPKNNQSTYAETVKKSKNVKDRNEFKSPVSEQVREDAVKEIIFSSIEKNNKVIEELDIALSKGTSKAMSSHVILRLAATNIDLRISKEITPSQKRNLLFNISLPLELLIQDFDSNWWPLISNVWTGFNSKKKANGDSSHTYTCRLTKHNQSSTRKEGIPSNKRRKTKIRPSHFVHNITSLTFIRNKYNGRLTFPTIFYTMNPSVSPATNIDLRISKEITPSQKRNLLFNISLPLELLIQDFDSNWWPLISNVWTGFNSKKKANGDSSHTYTCRLTKHNQSSTRKEGIPSNKRRKTKIRPSHLCFAKIKVQKFVAEGKVCVERFENSPDHTHSLEESDKVKRPQAIRNLVEQEAIKNYRPPAILNAVKEYAAETMDLKSSVKELRLKEVTNIKYKVRGTLDAHLIGSSEREKNIQESIFFLEQQKYQVERYMISNKFTHGFVFIHQKQIENLEKYGWLTLIDSTHKTNRYDYRLFTLYIRNGYSCWDVGAHFFVSNENSDTIAEALKIIRQFAPHWKPRYFLQD
ncbi:hypothetical protein Glove_170g31 [Diversispora epigaea]|uniref:ZSWIM1/3 RNaseH-like domain-containing protein n=1 Tax=Diversispora epigaea TaxID=1348612 RepID=A0A397IPA3_9GLOM|nr:hypothetical protein Glove_170g31 [Diversispora epigaea]